LLSFLQTKTPAPAAPANVEVKQSVDSAQSSTGAVASAGGSAIANSGEIGGVVLATVTNPLAEMAPSPQINYPCLQSSRLYLTDNSVPIAKSMVAKMHSYLKELGIPERPVPTKRVCDLIDQIRKDTITLMSLHNTIKKKEKEFLASKGGNSKSQSKGQPKGMRVI
jgi:hypothetical protein